MGFARVLVGFISVSSKNTEMIMVKAWLRGWDGFSDRGDVSNPSSQFHEVSNYIFVPAGATNVRMANIANHPLGW